MITITIELDSNDPHVRDDIVSILETALPYMAVDMSVSSHIAE